MKKLILILLTVLSAHTFADFCSPKGALDLTDYTHKTTTALRETIEDWDENVDIEAYLVHADTFKDLVGCMMKLDSLRNTTLTEEAVVLLYETALLLHYLTRFIDIREYQELMVSLLEELTPEEERKVQEEITELKQKVKKADEDIAAIIDQKNKLLNL